VQQSSASHALLVARLRALPLYRDYALAFRTTTGLSFHLVTAGNGTECGRFIAHHPVCALMSAPRPPCVACQKFRAKLLRQAETGACTARCSAGLSAAGVPVKIGDKPVAFLITEPMAVGASADGILGSLRSQPDDGDDAPAADMLGEAYLAGDIIEPARYRAAIRLLGIFAGELAGWANHAMIRAAPCEHPAIRQARLIIAQRGSEPLTLTAVARECGLSVCYFCKVFREATGLCFSEYVARVRLECAKKLLEAPACRISEAAFAAGFQSLSQFNRVFRAVLGVSPGEYRRVTPGRERAPQIAGQSGTKRICSLESDEPRVLG
jgi:AraC-like DNA-binding protein